MCFGRRKAAVNDKELAVATINDAIKELERVRNTVCTVDAEEVKERASECIETLTECKTRLMSLVNFRSKEEHNDFFIRLQSILRDIIARLDDMGSKYFILNEISSKSTELRLLIVSAVIKS